MTFMEVGSGPWGSRDSQSGGQRGQKVPQKAEAAQEREEGDSVTGSFLQGVWGSRVTLPGCRWWPLTAVAVSCVRGQQ